MKRQKKLIHNIPQPRWATVGATLALIIAGNTVNAQHTVSGVGVYYGIPDPSNHGILSGQSPYIVEIRAKNTTTWLSPHVFYNKLNNTYVGGNHEVNQKYYENLWGCSHSYVNFEMCVAAEIRITKRVGNIDSLKTKIHPANKVTAISFGTNSMTFEMPVACNIAVDIDGKMADRPHNAEGNPGGLNPVDTLSIHGNPPIPDKPTLGASNVLAVEPNPNPNVVSKPLENFSQDIMYFKPGIHYIGNNFKIYTGKKYYIPGDAIVYGTFNNVNDPTVPGSPTLGNANGVSIYGHGTICGSKFNHWELDQVELDGSYDGNNLQTVYGTDKDSDPVAPGTQSTAKYIEQQRISYRKNAIEFKDCLGSRVEGIVILDSANHNMKLFTPTYNASAPNLVSWVKIFAWRVNSDGSGINDSSMVENCFYRVQDDGFYPKGITLKNNVLWSDSNGACLRLSHLFQLKNTEMLVENIDVIFRRNMWWSNSGAIEMPETSDQHNKKFTFSNINVSDLNTNKPMFNLNVGNNGSLSNVTFKNVKIASNAVKNILKTTGNGAIHDLTFDNVEIAGQLVTAANFSTYFDQIGTNIYGLNFASTPNTAPTYGALPRLSWTFATNTNNSASAQLVKDGTSTRWVTGTPQVPGQFFQVNLGALQTINKVVFDNTGSSGDYPRGYRVETSTDANSWNTVFERPPGNTESGAITVNFASQTARYIKITQTGSAASNWWAIHELNVFGTQSEGGEWTSTNISGTGSSSVNSGVWDISSLGGDIFNASDKFHYRHQTRTGNFTIVAEVPAVSSAQQWAKAGLMIRDGTQANAKNAFINLSPTNRLRFQRRALTAASTTEVQATIASNPRFLKLTRSGDTFSAFYASAASGPWTQLGIGETIVMPAVVNVGLAVSSFSSTVTCNSTIKNVSITTP